MAKGRAGGREARGDWQRDMDATAHGLRAVAAVVLLVLTWTTGLADGREGLLTGYLLGCFLPFSLFDWWGSARFRGPTWDWIVSTGHVLSIFGVAVIAPEARIAALFGYVIVAVNSAILSGHRSGIRVAVVAVPLAVLTEVITDVDDAFSAVDLAIFGFALFFLIVMIDGLTSERRRTTNHLQRLLEALRAVAVEDDLPAVLTAVGNAAAAAVGAADVEVMVGDGDHLVHYRGSDPDPATRNLAAEVIARGAVVAVPFREHVLVGVPMRSTGRTSGAMVARIDGPGDPPDDDVALLVAFADHAAVVVEPRAVSFEHERETVARLEDANEQKRRFLEIVSHELRTPLSVNIGFLELVHDRWATIDDDLKRDMVRRAFRHAEELGRLVDQVVDVVDLDGDVVVVPEPLDLVTLIERAVARVRPQLRNHVVAVEAPPDVVVMTDPIAFERVLGSLLSNAAKFSEQGRGIRVSADLDASGFVTLAVEDEGSGIPEEHSDRVFELFFQVERNLPGAQGIGVGLALARRYAELQGSRVWLDRSGADGSRFCVSLPRAPSLDA